MVPDRPYKSSSSENTYNEDLLDLAAIRAEVERMARQAADWLARKDLLARTVTIKVRYADFSTVTRSHTAAAPTREPEEIVARALGLLDRTEAGRRPIRLLGAGVHGLAGGGGRASVPGVLDSRTRPGADLRAARANPFSARIKSIVRKGPRSHVLARAK